MSLTIAKKNITERSHQVTISVSSTRKKHSSPSSAPPVQNLDAAPLSFGAVAEAVPAER